MCISAYLSHSRWQIRSAFVLGKSLVGLAVGGSTYGIQVKELIMCEASWVDTCVLLAPSLLCYVFLCKCH